MINCVIELKPHVFKYDFAIFYKVCITEEMNEVNNGRDKPDN